MKFLNGLLGNLILVAVLLCIVAFFACKAIQVQKEQATNFYRYKDANALEMKSSKNYENYELVK
ncbi:DUF4006 family protein [Helicobacter cetorum]|uniref:DUF4006 domain-containing protein n=1 Tax=Helicobacter cetorum (strain ATCC BAA-429 / MIT 00-7128) TaxID=182217 RepID=I0EPY5_HELC0|nr:DUF4006 family protein [Helicobacter cetorum]AFI05004.1 hypothetical protein HCW_08745 [Helicobacter cetorum MIT 00-7128]